jgi:hypothetical protein
MMAATTDKRPSDDVWFIGFKVDAASVAPYVEEAALKVHEISQFLADATLELGEASEVGKKLPMAPAAVKDYYLEKRTCKLTARGLALLKTMDDNTDWTNALPNLRVPSPGFRARPFLVDGTDYEGVENYQSCYVDESRKVAILTIHADWGV